MPKKQSNLPVKPLEEYPELEFIPTGIEALDKICNGFPRGRLTEIYGKKSVGKTTLIMYMLAAISKDHKVLLIDAENALNINRVKELGAHFENIDYSTLSNLEEVGQLIMDSLKKYDVIVLDSIASTITLTEDSSEVGSHNVGNKGKVMNSIFNRRLPEKAAHANCAIVLINQLRDSFNLYGDKTYTPGGRAVEYAASLRIELNTLAADRIIEDGLQVGHNVTAKVTKSKVSAPYQTARFKVTY